VKFVETAEFIASWSLNSLRTGQLVERLSSEKKVKRFNNNNK